jgi:hypothetical protein
MWGLVRTDVSEEGIVSIMKATRIGELKKTLTELSVMKAACMPC